MSARVAGLAVQHIGVTTPGGTVMHWKRMDKSWADGAMGRTICGRTRHLLIDFKALPTCAQCERELIRVFGQ